MSQNKNDVPFNCIECCYGIYNNSQKEWDCIKGVFTKKECEYYYVIRNKEYINQKYYQREEKNYGRCKNM